MNYSWLREGVESAPITRGDLDQLENYADRLFAKVGIDVEFTRHFLDRVNDERNKRQITMAELTRLFKQEYKKYGKKIAQLGPDAEAVMKDMKTDVNMPFILRWDSKNQELDLVAKTVMRKKDFHTPDPEFAVEAYEINGSLVDKFLKATGGKYGKRDQCGPACLDFIDWAKQQGIELKRVRGEFVADEVVSAKADFTPEMKKEFAQSGLDWNSAADRKAWIEQSKYAEEWKRVPHYWTVDKDGNIHDPSGYQQLVRTGLAKDLDPSRYIPEGVNETSPFALAKRFIDPVIKHGSYEKAAKTLYDILRRKKKEDAKLSHGIAYYAQQLAKSFAGVDYRALEDYLRDHYDVAQFESKYTSMELAIMEGGHSLEDLVEDDLNTQRGRLSYYLKKQVPSGKAIHLSKLPKYHNGVDELSELVPERNGVYALHPDAWEGTFYSLTNKDFKKINFYKPSIVDVPSNSIVADMAIANQFYRTNNPEEKEKFAKAYKDSIVPYGSDTSHMKMPEIIMPGLAEGTISKALGVGAIAGALALGSNWSDKLPSAGDVANTDQAQVTQTVKQDPKVLPKSKPAVYKPITSSKNETVLVKTAQANGIKGVELAAFMAQMAHESENFKDMVEDNPNIKKYATGKTAKALGNKSKNDAERFIGRGFIQLTGRWNYEWMQKKLGIDLTSTWSKAHQASKPEVAAQIAVEFWKSRVRPNVDDWTDVAQVTKPINKALHGLNHREARFEKIMLAMNEETLHDKLQSRWLDELKIEKPDTKDTMGIKRNQMPQIATEDYPEFIDYLKDNGASFTKDTVDPKSLKAIQGEFSDSGVLKALKKRKLEKPIIASSDNYIIDGHHRWIAALNTGVDVNIYRVNKPGKELLQLVKDFPKTTYKDIYEAVGIITAQNTTKDVKPGETQRQAAKFGMKVDKNNNPPLLHKKAAKNSTTNKLFNIGIT